ncbi:hypothetical protein ACFWN7_12135 [Agromyces sp. NPDC058484]|uniref:hypothetical protein n=1 Tax=Agromyces sp. NPDC058484 TaxID=3346524 RepID=UPI003662B0CA
MRMRARVASLSAAVVIVGTLVGTAANAAVPSDWVWDWTDRHDRISSSLDTAAAAIPTAENPAVADNAVSEVRVRKPDLKGVASAVATSDCDGCDGRSTVFQVVYFNGRGAASADNSATAWSSCVGCSSSSVSVQLVVIRHPETITVNNRALALNVACDGCTTTSAAIQFVLAGGTRHDLSTQARELIAEIEEQLADRLAGAAQPDAAQPDARQRDGASSEDLVEETAQQLEDIILSDLGVEVSLQRSVDVQVGG